MEFAGFVAADAPDPSAARLAEIAGLGVAVAGLVPQPHLEERGETAVASVRAAGAAASEAVTVSRTYLLWRRPEDPDDPVNLAVLDERTRASLDAPLERPLPPWLMEARRLLRYPRLWEAVQTHWWAVEEERSTPRALLAAHAEHVLTNRFAEELGLIWPAWAPPVPEAALQAHLVVVDGVARPGLLLDTDPFVLGLATELDDGRVLTAVVAREDLPFVVLEFASDLPVG